MELTARSVLVLAIVLVGCEAPLTQVLVAVDTDLTVPDEIDRVVFEVRGPDGVVRVAEGSLASEADLPSILGLIPGNAVDGEVTVTALGMLGDVERLRRVAKFSFVADEVRFLWLELHRSCLSVSCGVGETCSAGGCRSAAANPDELHPYDPPITGPDRGSDGGVPIGDGGTPRTDGGAPTADGGTPTADGGTPTTDASTPDGGGVDASTPGTDGGPVGICTGLPETCGVGAAECSCDDCRCDVRCSGACSVDCRSSDNCTVDAAFTGSDFDGVCQSSTCQFDVRDGANVDIAVRAGGTLELDCRGANSCDVTCRGMSECLVRCDGSARCGIQCNPGSEVTCPGDVRVCNRACP